MADKRDLRVNNLDRYTKRSDRLILQTYSSCEVPLGCGGAIHRWVDPAQSLPFVLATDFGDRKCTVYLDGVVVRNARVDLTVGKHVLAFEFEPSTRAFAMRIALFCDSAGRTNERPDPKRNPMLLSQVDGQWFGTTTEPKDPWLTSTDPVPGWLSLRAMPKPARAKQAYLDRHIDKATSIGLVTDPGAAWARRVLTLDTSGDEWTVS